MDEVTVAACRWLLAGSPPGGYSGPDPGGGHGLSPLLAGETGKRGAAIRSEMAWLRRREAMSSALCRLAEQGTGVWAYKGFDLAGTLYPFPGARPMSDVDLFTSKRDLPGVLEVFRADGWSAASPGRGLLSAGIVSEIKLIKHGMIVELHTHIFYFPALFPGRFPPGVMARGRILGPGLQGFPWDFELLVVVLHMLSNSSVRPVWWTDTVLLCMEIGRSRLWREFARSAWMSRFARPVSEVLAVAAEAGAPVPASVLRLLEKAHEAPSGILEALRLGRGRPTVMSLRCMTGWRRISWFYSLMWMLVSGRSPLSWDPPEGFSLRGRTSSS